MYYELMEAPFPASSKYKLEKSLRTHFRTRLPKGKRQNGSQTVGTPFFSAKSVTCSIKKYVYSDKKIYSEKVM